MQKYASLKNLSEDIGSKQGQSLCLVARNSLNKYTNYFSSKFSLGKIC